MSTKTQNSKKRSSLGWRQQALILVDVNSIYKDRRRRNFVCTKLRVRIPYLLFYSNTVKLSGILGCASPVSIPLRTPHSYGVMVEPSSHLTEDLARQNLKDFMSIERTISSLSHNSSALVCLWIQQVTLTQLKQRKFESAGGRLVSEMKY